MANTPAILAEGPNLFLDEPTTELVIIFARHAKDGELILLFAGDNSQFFLECFRFVIV